MITQNNIGEGALSRDFECIHGVELSAELEENYTTFDLNFPSAFNFRVCKIEEENGKKNEGRGDSSPSPMNLGLRVMEPISKARTFLFEYAGVLSLLSDYDDIEDDDYIFGFEHDDEEYILNAKNKGNLARFCNHSCAPNCYAMLATHKKCLPTDEEDEEEGEDKEDAKKERLPRVLVFSLRPIAKGEELTLDYGLEWWKAKPTLSCLCKSANCKYSGVEGNDVRLLEDEAENGNVVYVPPRSHYNSGGSRHPKTARKSAGGKAPRKMLACKAARKGIR